MLVLNSKITFNKGLNSLGNISVGTTSTNASLTVNGSANIGVPSTSTTPNTNTT